MPRFLLPPAPATRRNTAPQTADRQATRFLSDPAAVRAFILREWERDLDYRLKRELWTFDGAKVSIRLDYEWHDAPSGKWLQARGEESWAVGSDGMVRRAGVRLAHRPAGAGWLTLRPRED